MIQSTGNDEPRLQLGSTLSFSYQPLVVALCFFAIVIAAPIASGQTTDAIGIGGQMFRLGMPRAEAMTKLNACCELTGSDDSFFIHSKNGPPFEILGAIWFIGGQVSALRLDRAHTEDAKTVAFILGLYRMVSDLTAGTASGTIGTNTLEMSNGTTRTITIRLQNGKTLVISVASPDAIGGSVQVSEERQR